VKEITKINRGPNILKKVNSLVKVQGKKSECTRIMPGIRAMRGIYYEVQTI